MTPFQRKVLIFFLIIPLILIIHNLSFAQLSTFKGIKLNDGTIIYGNLLYVNVYVVKMETTDGKTISIKFDDVQTFIDKAEGKIKEEPLTSQVRQELSEENNSNTRSRTIEGVKLNDGTVVYGKVLHMNVYTVRMETTDGKIVSMKFDDVETFIEKAEEKPKRQQLASPIAETVEEKTKRQPPTPLAHTKFREEKPSSIALTSTSPDKIIDILGQPYPIAMKGLISNFKNCNYSAALQYADSFVKATLDSSKSKQNKHLALLERGKIALAAGNHEQCIADLHEAEKRFLAIEGTISLTEGVGSLLTDDTAQEYEAEIHEKLMISPYLVLAYLSKGDFDGAIIERNRTITKINQYIEEKPAERAYLENPFARYLTAVMYEIEDKKDDAIIEYKKMKWDQEIVRLNSKKNKTTDLVVLVDVGLVPQKSQMKWGPQQIPVAGQAVSIGFAYATYAPTPTQTKTCDIYLNEKMIGNANLLYDLEKTVLTQYDKDKSAMIAKIVARMTAKAAAQIAAQKAADKAAEKMGSWGGLLKTTVKVASAKLVADEQADLRGWLTLPKQIKYIRMDGLEPGEYTVKIDYGSGVETKKIKLEKDKVNVAYFIYAK